MNWKGMLAYVTGSVDEELLLRNEYLITENRILRNQIKGRIRLTDPEPISLAEIAKRLSRQALKEVAQIVRPETILAWHRRLIAENSMVQRIVQRTRRHRRPRTSKLWWCSWRGTIAVWGYRRIAGALRNLGRQVSHQTVATRPVLAHDAASSPLGNRCDVSGGMLNFCA
jgi:hypothetical protein